MTDQPEQVESANSVTNVGGVNANAERIDIGADVVGRDKVVHINNYYAGDEYPASRIYHNYLSQIMDSLLGVNRMKNARML
jgi:hypothetical protein